MVTVIVQTDHDGVSCGFMLRGHAGRGQYGHDLVCASISAVVQTTVLGITDVLKLNADVELHDGEAVCILPRDIDSVRRNEAAVLIDTMEKGLQSIAEEYPKTLKFTRREV